MKNFIPILLFLLLVAAGRAYTQPVFPGDGPVFTDTIIPRIDILIQPDSLQAIFDNVHSNHEYPATFIFNSGHITDTLEQVGFRLRGNTSRNSPKKSFKISFNSFQRGRKYYGLEKMNINGEHNDPSVIRSKLCWDILRKLGVPASRANHVELYVNNNYFGLYINVEHVDEEFVFSRFGNMDGNLYKCFWPADLVYISDNPDEYKFDRNGRQAYDLHTNTSADDYSDLAGLISIINNTPTQDFECELEKVFNVDDYLKLMAFDVATGNWDNYSFLMNNYYLYHNTATGKFEFIPYDLDNTMGIDWFGIDWATRNIYNWQNPDEPRPLIERIMATAKYRDQYTHFLRELLSEIMDPAVFFPLIDSIHAMIGPSIGPDPYYPLSYGYTPDNFHDSYTQSLGAHVTYGLKPFISARVSSAMASLEQNNMLPVINYIQSGHPRLGESPFVSAFILDDEPGLSAELVYSLDNGPEETSPMRDDGMGPDSLAGDNIYTVALDPLASAGTISFRVRASSPAESTTEPCEDLTVHVFESLSPDLVINEFMASNALARVDEYGEFDDWVEIYNRDLSPVWLGDKYLSDDTEEPARWKLPDVVMAPGAFILIWTDGQNSQGPFHTNFRLRRSGEEIGIFESPERNSVIIDHMVFGAQQSDLSFGRTSDGGGTWTVFVSSTPGYSNLSTFTSAGTDGADPLRIFPNPVAGDLIHFSRIISVRLYDFSGRFLDECINADRMYIGSLPPGMYLLMSSDGESAKLLVR